MWRRKVASREEAQQLLEEWEESEESFVDFCTAKKVDGRSLHCWRLNLGRHQPRVVDAPPQVRLVELTVSKTEAVRTVYRLLVGDTTIEIDDNFRPDTLTRLLEVVRC